MYCKNLKASAVFSIFIFVFHINNGCRSKKAGAIPIKQELEIKEEIPESEYDQNDLPQAVLEGGTAQAGVKEEVDGFKIHREVAALFKTFKAKLTALAATDPSSSLCNRDYPIELGNILLISGPYYLVPFLKFLNEGEQLKKVYTFHQNGISFSTISSILTGSRSKSHTAFTSLFFQLFTERNGEYKPHDNFKKLEESKIDLSHLSVSLLHGVGITIEAILPPLIEVLSNPALAANLGKALELYVAAPTFHVIDSKDTILCRREALEMLLRYLDETKDDFKENDLLVYDENLGSYRVSDYTKEFRLFLKKYYNKGATCSKDLLAEKDVPHDYEEQSLRGQKMLTATKNIRAGTILGIYTGILLKDSLDRGTLSKDFQAELDWLHYNKGGGITKIDNYGFNIPLNEKEVLCLSGYGRGNLLQRINAHMAYRDVEPATDFNTQVVRCRYKGGVPFILFQVGDQDIKSGDQIFIDYGESYWTTFKEGLTDLDTHDSAVYKDGVQASRQSLRPAVVEFMNFLKKQSKNENESVYTDLYKEIIQNGIAPPHTDDILTREDIYVQEVKIDESVETLKKQKQWRLYPSSRDNAQDDFLPSDAKVRKSKRRGEGASMDHSYSTFTWDPTEAGAVQPVALHSPSLLAGQRKRKRGDSPEPSSSTQRSESPQSPPAKRGYYAQDDRISSPARESSLFRESSLDSARASSSMQSSARNSIDPSAMENKQVAQKQKREYNSYRKQLEKMTPEEKRRYLEKEKERTRRRRDKMTEEEKEKRNQKQREGYRKKIEKMTEEEREKRNQKQRERTEKMTEEEREKRNQKQKERRDNRTEEERKKRNQKERERRENMTEEERKKYLEKEKERNQKRKKKRAEEERKKEIEKGRKKGLRKRGKN